MLIEKNSTTQTWRNRSGKGSCHVSEAKETQRSFAASPPLPCKNTDEYITAPEDAMLIDWVPQLPRSGGYENFVTAVDMFFRFLLNYPTSNQDDKTIAKVWTETMTQHGYLPTRLILDKDSAFVSRKNREVAGVLDITLKHATTKHVRTIRLLEQSHASVKQALKIGTDERVSLWHKYTCVAVLNYNTSYRASIGCELSKYFHGSIPPNVLELKTGIRPPQIAAQNSQNPQDVLE